jgi:Ca-activated chloride channel family protein
LSFADPDFLYLGAAVVLVVAAGLWSHTRRRRHFAEFLGGRRAVERLSSSNLYRFRPERLLLLGGAAFALGVAAANPTWRVEPVEPPPPPPVRSIVIAIDVSGSMQATDVEPTRLAEAVAVARRILEAAADDRIGLLVFAGEAYALAPPTFDHRVIVYLLDGIVPTLASAQDPGTLLSAGLSAAVSAFGSEEAEVAPDRHIVVISDGEAGEPDAAVAAATEAARSGSITVHTLAVGTEVGAPMVMPRGQYQLGGQVVRPDGARAVSRLRTPLLRQVAELGGGSFTQAAEESQVEALLESLRRPVEPAVPPIRPPVWARYDLTFWAVAAALAALLLDSLLDARLPRLQRAPRRRLA